MNQATARPPPDRSGGSLDRLLPPTPRQRNAINVLNPLRTSFNDRKILDWLELTRSFWKTFEQQTDFDPPTEREVVALVTLASHDNDNIREWLRQSRGAGSSIASRYSTSTPASSLPNSVRSSRKFARFSSNSTTSTSSAYSSDAKHYPRSQVAAHPEAVTEEDALPNEMFTQSLMTHSGTPDDRQMGGSPSAETSDKGYRCSTGEHLPKARSATISVFRRHEKEHVDRYDCFSTQTALEEVTPSGRRCIICRSLNPDVAHLAEHHLDTCLQREESLTFTRADVFRTHLRTEHGLSSDDIKTLIKSRYHQINKTVFSCGLCVGVLFISKEKQVAHIVDGHLNQGQDMKDWDENKMIRSILRHPEINPTWNQALTSNPTISEQSLFWPDTVRGRVPLELDLGNTPAEKFVSMALEHAVENHSYAQRDDTRQPLPFLDRFGSPQTLNAQIRGVGSFASVPPSTGPFNYEAGDMIDESALMPSTPSLDITEASKSPTFPPLRFDSLPESYSHIADNGPSNSFDYMHLDQIGPGTVSPSQLSRKEAANPNQSSLERRPLDAFFGVSYTESAASGQPHSTSNISEASITAELDAHFQDSSRLRRQGPTSAPIEKKVSADAVKVGGTERYPWEDLQFD